MSFPRYERYKESGVEWLGEVPEGWGVKRLKHLLEILTDYTANGSFASLAENVNYLSDGFSRVVRLTDLRENLENTGIYVDENAHNYLAKSELFGGEILIANVGAYAGFACMMPAIQAKSTLGPNMYLMRFNSDFASNKFVLMCLLSNSMQEQLKLESTSTAQPKLNKDDVKCCFIAVPPVIEQEMILRFLDRETGKIDTLVSEQERLIALLKEKRQATITHAVTKGLNPDAPMKDSEVEWLGEVPEGWECGPLKRFAQVIDCKHYTVTFFDDGWPIVSIRELRDDKIDLSNAKMASKEEWDFLREGRIPAIGDMIFCRNASVGALGYVETDEPFCMGQDVCLIRPDFTSKFMHYLLTSRFVKEQIEALLVGATIRRANVEEIRNLVTAIPPPEEQSAIVTFLDSETAKIDTLVGEAQQGIGLLKERRSALISAAVTGKIDVRNMAAALSR